MPERPFQDSMTLGEARAKLRELIDEGERCPCCTQMAKVYRRKINSTMARTLITLYRHSPTPGLFVHGPSLPGDTHEISQLAWWDLVVEERARRTDGGRTGWWCLTPLGSAFVRGEGTVAKYARIYDGRRLSLVGAQVTIHGCLGSRFNYSQLMAGV